MDIPRLADHPACSAPSSQHCSTSQHCPSSQQTACLVLSVTSVTRARFHRAAASREIPIGLLLITRSQSSHLEATRKPGSHLSPLLLQRMSTDSCHLTTACICLPLPCICLQPFKTRTLLLKRSRSYIARFTIRVRCCAASE
jgi:hypothetical protein